MTSDAEIGARILDLRVARGMTQGEVATAMRDAGWPLAQPAIAKIELGKRPLRLSEAASLAGVLAVGVPALTGSSDGDSFADGYRAGVTALRDHIEKFDA